MKEERRETVGRKRKWMTGKFICKIKGQSDINKNKKLTAETGPCD